MSATVAERLEQVDLKQSPEEQPMAETVDYIRLTNKLFDVCNVRSLEGAGGPSEARRKKNPDLLPFASAEDPRLEFFQEVQDYLRDWYAEVRGDYGSFLSQQTYSALMTNTTSIPAFIKWALEAGIPKVLTSRLQTDDVESANAELRQVGGDRRNPTVAEAFAAIPQVNLAKQCQKLIQHRGSNVDPALLTDPELTSEAAYARRLAALPALPARPEGRKAQPQPQPFVVRSLMAKALHGGAAQEATASPTSAPTWSPSSRPRATRRRSPSWRSSSLPRR